MNLCASPRKNSLMDQNAVPSFNKGRRDDWKHEVNKSQCNVNLKLTYGDRFIPKRFNAEDINYTLKYLETNKEKDILMADEMLVCSYWRQNSFVRAINETFGVRNSRLLQFSNLQSHLSDISRRTNQDCDWPCTPRPRPMAYPNTTHEMPRCSLIDHNLMDWSINGHMAVSLGQDVIIWHNQGETTMVFSVKRPRSLKYSPNGRYLAMGCTDSQHPVLELWKLKTAKEFLVADGKYFQKSDGSICAIEWSQDSQKIVCGTGSGLLVVLQMPTLRTLYKLRKHTDKISSIRYSPNGQYLATADVQGLIYIFHSRQYKVLIRLRSKSSSIIFDWHPWSGVELAISEKSPPSIYIFNVPRREIVAFYQRADKKIMINSINFSKITGELLVNVYRYDDQGCLSCEILVLSSFNRVVDIMGYKEGGMVFMMWSPDGTKIATAGLDESLSIWNFLHSNKVHDTKAKNRVHAMERRNSLELYRLFK
ncbi:protein cortex [Drosophila nasuta]|uniref:protein cortex n=1 Tax=Drosophila nasuta TaxID=42062 RepID=UPI00295E7C43|nr:protein cortex [Drosophila nasuta]